MNNRFQEGDFVKRLTNVFNSNSRMRYGIIIRCYTTQSKFFGYYPELYEVWWHDNGRTDGGYLPHGLIKDE